MENTLAASWTRQPKARERRIQPFVLHTNISPSAVGKTWALLLTEGGDGRPTGPLHMGEVALAAKRPADTPLPTPSCQSIWSTSHPRCPQGVKPAGKTHQYISIGTRWQPALPPWEQLAFYCYYCFPPPHLKGGSWFKSIPSRLLKNQHHDKHFQ